MPRAAPSAEIGRKKKYAGKSTENQNRVKIFFLHLELHANYFETILIIKMHFKNIKYLKKN